MAWVIGGILVLGLLIWFAGRRARHQKVYDQHTWERIGAHGVELQGRASPTSTRRTAELDEETPCGS